MKNSLQVFILLVLFTGSVFAQEQPKEVGLVYDSSYGMRTKDFSKELAFLGSYFNQNPNCKVYLRTFSNTIILEEEFLIEHGDWSLLREELGNTIYDGASNFDGILPTGLDEILFITDGLTAQDNLPKSFEVPVNVIVSTTKSNNSQLRDLALGSGGAFIDANAIEAQQNTTASDGFTVTGVVYDDLGPLSEVSVYSPETQDLTVTDLNGAYSILVSKEGTLEFSYIGKRAIKTKVPSTGKANVQLFDVNEVLEEVVLKAKAAEEEELVNTGNQMVDKKRLGYAVETIGEDDIGVQDIDVETAIQGQFSNIELKSDQSLTQFLSRGKNMTILGDQTGLVVIDGVPIESSPSSLKGLNSEGDKIILGSAGMVSPDNIASITVLKGLAATNKYGTLGRNGVILITTKTALGASARGKKDIKLGTTATYDGNANLANTLPNTPYIKALQTTTTIDDAYAVYLRQRKAYGNDASYFINVAAYFKNWNNPFMLERILSNVNEVEPTIEDLRALAYNYQQLGLSQQAVDTYERIKNIDPSQVQVYRNLALAYVQNNQLDEALEIYKRFDTNAISQVTDFGTLRKTMVNEYKNLLELKKTVINRAGLNDFYFNNITYATRVIFEWSDFDANFDLQIVNPQKRYFTWSHTPQAEAARMRQEQSLGYGLEEFFMTSADKGEWLFNLTYYGKNGGDATKPTYLKITTIHDFGKANQSEKVQVITLLDEGNSQTVLKLDLN